MSPFGPTSWPFTKVFPTGPIVDPEEPEEPTVPGVTPPLQSVLYSSVGQVNPYNVLRETPFVQSVAVPLNINVPQGTYGVRIGNRQLAAQALSIKHRPNGNARLLRVEGVWPSDLTTAQTISLTALPPSVTPEVTVELSSGNLLIKQNGVTTQTVTPYASTSTLSGNKLTQLKGSNSSAAYIPSISFHEWHVPRTTPRVSVDAEFLDITTEENTSILRTYLARGKGNANDMYEFQMRITVYKYRPWVRWEYTTFKHFPVNAPGASSGTTMQGIASERLTITPAASYTSGRIKDVSGPSVAAQFSAFGISSGLASGTATESAINAVRMAGPNPLSVSVHNLSAMGPSALRATTGNLLIDLWSEHTDEVLDFRGTGTNGEEQCEAVDYNASPRGTGRTWEGFFILSDSLSLAQQLAAKDDLWFMTAAALEASEAFGPLKAAAATEFAPYFRRIRAANRVAELAAENHQYFGYAQYGLVPAVIPAGTEVVDSSICATPANGGAVRRYVAKQPMHSGRFGQSKDGTGIAGGGLFAILTGDRAQAIRALSAGLMKCDINGHHQMLFGVDYMGSSRDGTHRRYRDPWTGKSNDTQYMYPEGQYTAYWLGGARRHVERASRVADRLYTGSTSGYAHSVWGWAVRYEHTHDPADLARLNAMVAETISDSNAESDFPQPSGLNGKISSVMWENFRYGHNTCAMVEALYEATGNSQYLDDMALAIRTYMSFPATARAKYATNDQDTIAMYGNFHSFYHIIAYLKLRGYSSSQVPNAALVNMDYWMGDHLKNGTLRYFSKALPPGSPEDYTWSQAQGYHDSQIDEGAGFEQRHGLLIASWYSTQ